MSETNEVVRREAQGKLAAKLEEAKAALMEAKALADMHGLHFSFEAPDADGGFSYYGDEYGGSYSLDGEWYSSNC